MTYADGLSSMSSMTAGLPRSLDSAADSALDRVLHGSPVLAAIGRAVDFAAAHPVLLAAVVFGAVIVWTIGGDQVAAWRHRRLAAGARWVSIAPPPEVDPGSAADLWTTLAGVLTPSLWRRRLYGTPHVAWEYAWAGRTLTIKIWVPGTIPAGSVEAAVRAAWPACTLATGPAEAPVRPNTPAGDGQPARSGRQERRQGLVQAGGALWPQHRDAIPLRTEHDSDPLRALLAAGAQISNRELACVQILARPATARRTAALRRTATAAARPPGSPGSGTGGINDPAGGALLAATGLARAAVEPILWFLEIFLPVPVGRAAPTRAGQTRAGQSRLDVKDPVAEAHRRSMADKATGVPHYEIAIRYAVAAPAPTGPTTRAEPPKADAQAAGRQARQRVAVVRHRLTGLAHTIASAAAAYTRPNRLRRMKMPQPVAVLAGRRLRRGFLATVEELAVLAALPQDLAVPGLDRARAKAMPAPVSVPAGGRSVKVLGRAQVGGHAVGLDVVDARQHVHLVGKTGVGKSTLLLNMILADIHARRGVVVIDPRGDLVTDILDRLPASYAEQHADRIAIIDPDQPNPACFNPLDITNATGGRGLQADAHLAVDNIVGIFSKIFQRHWGPRIDDTLRVSCLTLMRDPMPTLAQVPQLLNSREFRTKFTAGLNDPEGLGGFWAWYNSMNDGLRAQVIGPVLARLRAFLLRDFVKNVIGTPHSSFQMADILNGGLLLCRLPKGILGEDTARILGSLIVARTWQAAIARAGQPEQTRRDASLYIDECHNFLTLPGSIDDMLAEARGFRLSLVLAHQNLAQLPRETQAALSANARTKIFFNVEPNDARDLARHTKPELDEHDLAHLDVHTAAGRLLVGNRELPAFTFTTNPPPAPAGHAQQIRDASAARHARPAHPGKPDTTSEPGADSGIESGVESGVDAVRGGQSVPRRDQRSGQRSDSSGPRADVDLTRDLTGAPAGDRDRPRTPRPGPRRAAAPDAGDRRRREQDRPMRA